MKTNQNKTKTTKAKKRKPVWNSPESTCTMSAFNFLPRIIRRKLFTSGSFAYSASVFVSYHTFLLEPPLFLLVLVSFQAYLPHTHHPH